MKARYIGIGLKKNIGTGIGGIGKIKIIGIGNQLSVSLKSVSVFKYRPNPYRSISIKLGVLCRNQLKKWLKLIAAIKDSWACYNFMYSYTLIYIHLYKDV